MNSLARLLRPLAALLFLSLCAHAQALDLTLANAKPDTGDGGWLTDYQWASDPVHGAYWQSITILGTEHSWMTRETPWGYALANTTTLSTNFTQAASVSFDWLYTSYDSKLSADAGGYILNGLVHTLSSTSSATTSGHLSLTLAAGDTLAWYVSSTDMLGGRATLALRNVLITAVLATTPVPEPAPAAMLLSGLLMLGLIARRRLAAHAV